MDPIEVGQEIVGTDEVPPGAVDDFDGGLLAGRCGSREVHHDRGIEVFVVVVHDRDVEGAVDVARRRHDHVVDVRLLQEVRDGGRVDRRVEVHQESRARGIGHTAPSHAPSGSSSSMLGMAAWFRDDAVVSAPPPGVTVLLVDDHRAITEAVASALRSEGFEASVAPSVDAASVLEAAEQLRPGVALVDLFLGEGVDGADLVEPLRERGAAVVVLSGLAADDRRGVCLRRGAAAVLDKSLPFDELVAVIRAVAAGEPAMRPAERDRLLAAAAEADAVDLRRQDLFGELTARERTVLGHLAAGRSATDIAERDGVKLSTVRSQIQSILHKLDVPSQQAAIALAHRERFEP